MQFGCSFAIQKHFLSSQAQVNTAGPIAGIVEVPLAQTGEGNAECELLQWFVQEVSAKRVVSFPSAIASNVNLKSQVYMQTFYLFIQI